jgi:hypothetical protein
MKSIVDITLYFFNFLFRFIFFVTNNLNKCTFVKYFFKTTKLLMMKLLKIAGFFMTVGN